MTILDELATYAKERVQKAQAVKSLEELREQALALPKGDLPFSKALRKTELSFICECKKASPSKGIIATSFPYLEIAKQYEKAGADCISVLTEPKWFLGSDAYLQAISSNVQLPCLRKDFVVDEYMLYEAKLLGAAAVLLICTILSEAQLKKYLGICAELGLDALVEVHDEQELQLALKTGAQIIGVNNRNLKDFTVDMENSRRLRALVPPGVLFVVESGVSTVEDVRRVKTIGADAVLIGEALMRAPDKISFLRELKNA
ncbi:MAG: indole-3-glycerol phosphate synthase TrpC [Phascolarctobacterium sp.]|nr:indole-3-glycerol phosphate synthase TrpC [Phascolarctobacterium sp.]